jgi:very-short-patch-repair endonuclease
MVQQSRFVTSAQRQLLRRRAQRMRHEPTQTEWLLWQSLRGGKQGVTFRRQVVLQGYIADYYACTVRPIVEVDGAWHGPRAAADRRRDRTLAAAGYRILRVSAERILTSLPEVLACIREAARG